MNLNSPPPSHFPMHQITSHDNDHEHPFLPNRSSSVSCHFFFDPTRDHAGFYDHPQLYQPTHHIAGDQNYGYHGGSAYETKSVDESSLKLTLWKKEDDDELQISSNNNSNPMRWMSSKMRVMQKMKKTDHDRAAAVKTTAQQPSSSSAETDLSSNSSSYNNNSPIRVCSDCNTTKTPLWRSGPKGPKSLCNACGIRQRKARRAMAAAANGAAANGGGQPPAMKIKLQQKGKNGQAASQLKKRCKTSAVAAAAAGGNVQKRIGFEDFLINLSKNLAFHRVFPDDEKDAAILLMALSSGLVNG
ncbi:putative GATA transcription factor 22 [Salvia miltiorrhiza]|uniref:putative GATA transcription factor 22 n=1 Tax=Salvia miltiorrhiza TaxID=226208 RepID=UPI0025AD2DC8|nr:putative GATA transcription factor 22 [Salvia miltiorrhiza]